MKKLALPILIILCASASLSSWLDKWQQVDFDGNNAFSANLTTYEDKEDDVNAFDYSDQEFDAGRRRVKRNVHIDPDFRWPNAVIAYNISDEFRDDERKAIKKAMLLFEEKTCIRFKQHSTEPDYVSIIKGERNRVAGPDGRGSGVGRRGPNQHLMLSKQWSTTLDQTTTLHELMHVAGFKHEHQRPDRDEYVTTAYSNANYARLSECQFTTLNAPYDFCSVMHYSLGKNSVQPKNPPAPECETGRIGRPGTFSKWDVLKINTYYQCSGRQKINTPGMIWKTRIKI